jgi:DNA-directed RNA polymerase specialized sigma24 family protein
MPGERYLGMMVHRRDWERADDETLLGAILAREEAACEVFYRRHLPRVLAYLLRETGDREATADLAAEVFASGSAGA